MFAKFSYSTHWFPNDLLLTKSFGFFILLINLFPTQSLAQGEQFFENPIILENSNVGSINDVVVDINGFLWIAGRQGLAKYDGSQFKVFRHDPKDSLSLMDNEINDLNYNEKTNEIFISSWNTATGGLSILDLESEKFTNIRFDSKNSVGLEGHGLYWTFQDHFGKYWTSLKGRGLINYFPEQDSVVQFPYLPSIEEKDLNLAKASTFLSFSNDAKNDSIIWLGAIDGSLLKFNVVNHQYTRYPLFESTRSSFRKILHHADNNIYIGTWTAGFYIFNPSKQHIKKLEFEKLDYEPKRDIKSILEIKAKSINQLYITTDAGLIEYDIASEKVIQSKINDENKSKFYGYFEKDKKDRILFWEKSNLYIFDPSRQQNKFYNYGIKSRGLDFLVRSIIEDKADEKLWIAAQFSEGLYRLDLKVEEWEVFPPPNSFFDERQSFMAWDVLKTRSGEVLVLESENGIYTVLEKEKRMVPWDIQLKSSKNRCMIEDRAGNIWVGTANDGVYKINPTTKEVRHFYSEFLNADVPGIGAAMDIKEDRNGNIWIRSKGLKVYNPKNDSVYLFPYFFPDQKAVYHISSLGIDGDGNVFAGSHEGSLGFTDADHPEKGIVNYYDFSQGLKIKKPLSFILDREDNIWAIAFQGLEKIKSDRSMSQLYRRSYFSYYEPLSITYLSNGTFAFGDRHGINITNPDRLQINHDLSHPYINSFKVFDNELKLENSFFKTSDVYLNPEENFFSIEFSALKPSFYGSTKFQYKLEGVDSDWVFPENRRYVAYTNVASGSYNFKLKSSNNEGVWNEIATILKIHIATPWYKTWWAYLLWTLMTLSLIYYGYRFQKNRRKEQEEALRLKDLDTFKTRFYSNITHEFRTPLTVIQGMAQELKENLENDSEKKLNLIDKNSRSLLNLVNQMLDLSKIQAGKDKADLVQDEIIIFLKLLVESHESYANMQHLGLQFYSEEDHLIMDFDAKKLERVLTNLLSNAIKFTPEYGKILVHIKKVRNAGKPFLEIKVRDSGIGIQEENLPFIFDRFHQANPIHNNQGTGIGLSMVKELTSIMNGMINVKSKLNEGSTFILTIPIQNKALKVQKGQRHRFSSLPIQSIPPNRETILSENGLPIILIIEDNIDLDYYLKSCLKEQYQTVSCRNGKEGVEKALEVLPDIIISDVMMPEMNGFEVCKIVKEDDRSSHIPIILLTAKASIDDKLMGLTQGADAYLTKPFEKEELLIRLEKLLLIRKTLQEKYSNNLISTLPFKNKPATKEEVFLQKLEDIILSHMDDEDFSIHHLSRELTLSRSQVHRKIKALTGLSTSIYIRHVRLQKAKELLKNTDLSVSEIAYQVGFKTLSYFSQSYKEAFGENPSATRK